MRTTFSAAARRALLGLHRLHAEIAVANAHCAARYVAQKQREANSYRRAHRIASVRTAIAAALKFLPSSGAQTAIAATLAIALAIVLATQPERDAIEQLTLAKNEALAREQGKNDLRAAQDAELIKHHAQGAITLRIVARKDDAKAMRAVSAALVELGGK
jgi:hypothetical protein